MAGCDDGKLRSWDLSVGSGSLREFEDVNGGGIYSLCVQEGVGPMRVISSTCYGEVRLWDVESARCLCVLICTATPEVSQLVAADLHRLVYANGNDVKMLDFSL